MMNNKIGYSTGFAWVFGLVTLFGLGLLYIVFNQVFVGHLVPVIKGMNNDSYVAGAITESDFNEVNSGIDQYMSYF
ncbi:hypothetical protein DRN98_07450, partial [Methanosarcinales archaeon]